MYLNVTHVRSFQYRWYLFEFPRRLFGFVIVWIGVELLVWVLNLPLSDEVALLRPLYHAIIFGAIAAAFVRPVRIERELQLRITSRRPIVDNIWRVGRWLRRAIYVTTREIKRCARDLS